MSDEPGHIRSLARGSRECNAHGAVLSAELRGLQIALHAAAFAKRAMRGVVAWWRGGTGHVNGRLLALGVAMLATLITFALVAWKVARTLVVRLCFHIHCLAQSSSSRRTTEPKKALQCFQCRAGSRSVKSRHAAAAQKLSLMHERSQPLFCEEVCGRRRVL